MQVHVSVLFCVVAYLGADIASLYPWKPVVVSIFDLDEKWIDTIVFAIDDSLCEDDCVVSDEGEFSRPIFG